ncbi:redoxin family protein [Nocardioides panacisoli]|uniref:redoxin family protein n=1 Tax=Nocardioides panacisoli TaxID=627624 RepID=UPI001C639A34|nr:redoxin family protein [Nocardioides panacisoli]QYJ02648.1 redoxin family protein [Nocardioides panacisoli]
MTRTALRALARPILATGLVLGLAACSGEAEPTASSTASATPSAPEDPTPADDDAATEGSAEPATATPTAEAPVPEVLEFEATTVGGRSFEGASLAGQPVVVWFWAPWCPVCRGQAEEVTDLSQQYGDQVAFVGVGSLDGGDAIASFAEDAPGPTHLSDPDGALYRHFGITEQSSFVVLDDGGEEVLRTGYGDDAAIADAVAGLVG